MWRLGFQNSLNQDFQDDFVENLPLQRSAMYVAIIAPAGRYVYSIKPQWGDMCGVLDGEYGARILVK